MAWLGSRDKVGQAVPDFLRFLAENDYYGDVEALVANRVESLRNPSNQTFEDRAPSGRVYRRPNMAQAGVRLAPELTVTMWFNGREPLTLAQLRGREGSATFGRKVYECRSARL